jgi:hypothetical protein
MYFSNLEFRYSIQSFCSAIRKQSRGETGNLTTKNKITQMKTNYFQKFNGRISLFIIAMSFCLAIPGFSQDRIDVYHHVPVTETYWSSAKLYNLGVSYYPAANLYNAGTNSTKEVPMYYFDLRVLNFDPDNYKPLSLGVSLGYYMTRPEDGDQKFNGGDLNLCLFHLPENTLSNAFSIYGGVIAGAGIGTTTYFHGEGCLGVIMALGKGSGQAINIDGGYNFSKYKDTGTNWYIEPKFFVRIGICFGEAAGSRTTTTYY